MPVTLYQSSDAGAPTLTGEANSLINLLTQCLVNGYGSTAGAGWTKPFTGTAKAVFKAGGGNQACLWIDDNAPGAGGAREARMRGFEAMTALDTGTGAFPTTGQMNVPVIVRKSQTSDNTTRPWIVAADAARFYLFTQSGDSTTLWSSFFFGDINSIRAGGDPYAAAIIGRYSENSSSTSIDMLQAVQTSGVNAAAQNGHFIARSHTGIGSAVQFAKIANHAFHSGTTLGGGTTFSSTPNPPDGGYYFSRVGVVTSGSYRGDLPGLWAPCHTRPFESGDLVAGGGEVAGRTLLTISCFNNGQFLIDIVGPW